MRARLFPCKLCWTPKLGLSALSGTPWPARVESAWGNKIKIKVSINERRMESYCEFTWLKRPYLCVGTSALSGAAARLLSMCHSAIFVSLEPDTKNSSSSQHMSNTQSLWAASPTHTGSKVGSLYIAISLLFLAPVANNVLQTINQSNQFSKK